MRSALALARLLHLNQWRRAAFRRSLLVAIFGSLVVVVLLGAVDSLSQDRSEGTDRRVGVAASDLDAARSLLATSKLDILAETDASRALASGRVHLVVRIDRGVPTLVYDPTSEASLEAYGRAHAALSASSEIRRTAVDDLPRVRRYEAAKLLMLLAALLLPTAVLAFAAGLVAGRAGSPAESLLAAPLDRRWISAAIAMGAFPSTALLVGAFLGAGMLGIVFVAGTSGLAAGPLIVSWAAVTVSLTSVGCSVAALGAGLARSQGQVGAVNGLSMLALPLLSLVMLAAPTLTSGGPASWVPVTGPQLAFRDAMSSSVPGMTWVRILLVSGVVVIGSVALSGRWLGADGRGLRT